MSRSFAMLLRFAALLLGIFTPLTAQAAFHLWDIVEVYSSSTGSVQFIELFTTGPGENVETGAQIRTDSGNMFNIGDAGPLSGNTSGDRLLFATAGFYSLPGAPAVSATQPTYVLPANFFNPTSDRIRLFSPGFGEFEIKTINAANPIPTDNVFARTYTATTTAIAANSPQARDVTAGSINRGDYNNDGEVNLADYAVWRKTVGLPASPAGSGADGDTDGTIDDGDYTLWTRRFGNDIVGAGSGSGGAAIPEPATVALALLGLALVLPAMNPRNRVDCR
ncbi:MAG: hypothetical protein L0228_08585 [Planctomycetes bacterium]|nr:hypothetical protein [Planctomycetota bacterium]